MIASSEPGPTGTVERLQNYARFVGIVAEQLEAARTDDVERLRRLEEERVALERELTTSTLLDPPVLSEEDNPDSTVTDEALARLQDELDRALSTLDERFDTERWTEQQMALLSDGAIRSARSMPAPRSSGRPYPILEERTTHLDRRF